MEVTTMVRSRMAKDKEKDNTIALKISPAIEVVGRMDSNTAKEYLPFQMVLSIKDSLAMDWDLGKVKWNMCQEISIKDNGKMIKKMEKESWIGSPRFKDMKDNGKMINCQVKEHITGLITKLIAKLLKLFSKDNGNKEKDKATAPFSTTTAVVSKELLPTT